MSIPGPELSPAPEGYDDPVLSFRRRKMEFFARKDAEFLAEHPELERARCPAAEAADQAQS